MSGLGSEPSSSNPSVHRTGVWKAAAHRQHFRSSSAVSGANDTFNSGSFGLLCASCGQRDRLTTPNPKRALSILPYTTETMPFATASLDNSTKPILRSSENVLSPGPINPNILNPRKLLTGPKPKEIKVETFRIDYLIRTPKVEKLSLQPVRFKDKARSPNAYQDPNT